jgi:hypothetical protein
LILGVASPVVQGTPEATGWVKAKFLTPLVIVEPWRLMVTATDLLGGFHPKRIGDDLPKG